MEETVVFAVVGGKVLEGGADALALHTFYIRLCQIAGKHSVLGKVFKVSSAQGSALEVDSGTENHGDVFSDTILGDCLSHAVYKLFVKGIAERRQRRIADRWL